MSRKDIEEKDYFNDVLHFADTCNGILFQGECNILPEDLEESDTELIYMDKKLAKVVRIDGMRYWKKQGVNIALLGLEYQSLTDYHMVFRNMMAESMTYYKQWKMNKRKYSKEYLKWFGRLFKLRNSKEFLSGMTKEDRFIPVILIVINLSPEKWDGATSLHEMLKLPDSLKRYVNNYKLNIFDYYEHNDFSVFKTEVRVIFEALKAAKEESCMKKVFSVYEKVELATARLIETLLNITFDRKYIVKDEEGRECMEMCKAWDDHWKSGQRDGIAIGMEKGIEKGIAVFIQDKIADGVEEERIVSKLVFFYQLSNEDAKEYVRKYR